MKLHLGCGDVYLDGWINIDIYDDGRSFFPYEREDILEYNKTDVEHYYKHQIGDGSCQIVADKFMDLTEIPYPYKDDSVDEILVVGVFEHFDKNIARDLLREWYRILKNDCRLTIDVPDMMETFEVFKKDPNFGIRLIYGSQKNEHSYHKWGYTFDTLSDRCKKAGFRIVNKSNLIKHDYPVFGVEAIK